MKYYLDTSVIIPFINGSDSEFKDKMSAIPVCDIKIPSMVNGELITGAYKVKDIKKEMDIITGFVNMFEVIPFDLNASVVYGRIRADLEKKGKRIGSNDLIIAATVLSRGGTLVTKNTKEFSRVEGLRIEDWSS
ncbi:MAG: type II toxin-antitoxin system VapC family toxin [Methanomassiliicoccaceae archaeon]|nr:type II toxin-antitoxin system VapC family toxin [Methanomassiliicoccaceae archaeon]